MIGNDVTKIKNKSREIKPDTERMLWAVSAGRCEFEGCNRSMLSHHVTGDHGNFAQMAHIYAFSQGGRRHNTLLGLNKINDFDNLMLACPVCHKLIDDEKNEHIYTASELIGMKKNHEERIRKVVQIAPDKKTSVVIYNSRIASRDILICDHNANSAVIPEHYPEHDYPWRLSPNVRLFDYEEDYWSTLSTDLDRGMAERIAEVQQKHISLFAIAPQPLLFKLGTLLNRNYQVDVRQSQGSLDEWGWKNDFENIEILKRKHNAEARSSEVALIVDLTCSVSFEAVNQTCGDIPIYEITIENPNGRCIKKKEDLAAFVSTYNSVLNEIRTNHSNDVVINLFPVSPASISVEMGRHWTEKGDPMVIIYDRNAKNSEFQKTLTFGGKNHDK